jgi:hypothetical protein
MIEAALERHDARRRDGRPTISTLVGNHHACRDAWRCWAAARHRPAVVVAGEAVSDWLATWLAAIIRRRSLGDAAAAYLAGKRPRCSRHASFRRGPQASPGIEPAWTLANVAGPGASGMRLARWLAERRREGAVPDATEIAARQSAWLDGDERRLGEAFAQVLDLIDPATSPAMLVLDAPAIGVLAAVSGEATAADRRRRLPSVLAALALRAPTLAVGAAFEEQAWQRACCEGPATFARNLMREYAVSVAGASLARERSAERDGSGPARATAVADRRAARAVRTVRPAVDVGVDCRDATCGEHASFAAPTPSTVPGDWQLV